jgi:peptidoglycan biosynthesis protein MviN/MurJ (putative lipid II flippase)
MTIMMMIMILLVVLSTTMMTTPNTATTVVVSAFTPVLLSSRSRISNSRVNRPSHLQAAETAAAAAATTPDMDDVGFVVLAGGTGSRMKANMRT